MQNQQKFLDIIKNPYELDKSDLSFIDKMTAEYPYCQTLQILRAKGIQNIDKLEFERQVNKASAYAVDRRKFQRFISDKDRVLPETETSVIESTPVESKSSRQEDHAGIQAISKDSSRNGNTKQDRANSLLEIVKRRLDEIRERKENEPTLVDKPVTEEPTNVSLEEIPQSLRIDEHLNEPERSNGNDNKPVATDSVELDDQRN
jgi:hypothetical protein